jgi:hypothetical protein
MHPCSAFTSTSTHGPQGRQYSFQPDQLARQGALWQRRCRRRCLQRCGFACLLPSAHQRVLQGGGVVEARLVHDALPVVHLGGARPRVRLPHDPHLVRPPGDRQVDLRARGNLKVLERQSRHRWQPLHHRMQLHSALCVTCAGWSQGHICCCCYCEHGIAGSLQVNRGRCCVTDGSSGGSSCMHGAVAA